jgi:hypothetical protein
MKHNVQGGATPTTAVWREQALAEIAQARLALDWLTAEGRNGQRVDDAALAEIRRSLERASDAAVDRGLRWPARVTSSFRGASVERAWGQIDAASEALLRVAPSDYVIGQLPRITRRVKRMLKCDDPRRAGVERVAARFATDSPPRTVSAAERETLLVAYHAANCEARRKQSRVRSFRNMILLCGLVLTVAAVGLAALGYAKPKLALVCFQPSGQAVCPTRVVATGGSATAATGQPAPAQTPSQLQAQDHAARAAAGRGDVLLVEIIGLIAAALAAATALRSIHGTSTPYGVPFAVAVLKLPSGALTAAFGLLLMRADFVPGLSALDTPAQILGWAIVFGYAQQLFTRFVDARAQTVLDTAGAGEAATPPTSRPSGAAALV